MQNTRFWLSEFVLFSLFTWATFSFCLGQDAAKLEDSIPQEFRNRSDVEVLIQKLRLLRKNDSSLGEKHPKKKSTQAKISECEAALKSILELKSQPSPQSAVSKSSINIEDSLPQELLNRTDIEPIIQKLLFLRMNDANFGEKHPKKQSTQLQIRENELALINIIEHESPHIQKSVIAANSNNIEDSLSQELRKREDVNLLVCQLLFLRINLTSFRENHPDRKEIQEQIQKQESALLAIAVNPRIRMRSTKVETTLMQALEDRKDVQVLVHKLTVLRFGEATYGEERSIMTTIKSEIRKHEASLLEIIRLDRTVNGRSNPVRRVPDNDLN
ncbi:MAG: hypothetical protein NTU79_17335 [Planctomycetota bacterium]|nr:hypothetical protein [Planctomycetota bacterium]